MQFLEDRTQRSADYDLSAEAKPGRRRLTQKGGVWEMEETPNSKLKTQNWRSERSEPPQTVLKCI